MYNKEHQKIMEEKKNEGKRKIIAQKAKEKQKIHDQQIKKLTFPEWKIELANLKLNVSITRKINYDEYTCTRVSDEEIKKALDIVWNQDLRLGVLDRCDICGGKLYRYFSDEETKDCHYKYVCKDCNLDYDELFYDAFG